MDCRQPLPDPGGGAVGTGWDSSRFLLQEGERRGDAKSTPAVWKECPVPALREELVRCRQPRPAPGGGVV